MAFKQYPLPCRFWAELTQIWALSASWSMSASWKRVRSGHVASARWKYFFSKFKKYQTCTVDFVVLKKFKISFGAVWYEVFANLEPPQLVFWHNFWHFMDKRSPWWSKWGSGDRKYSKSSKIDFFAHHKVPQKRVAAILTPNYHWMSDLKRHDHSWHARSQNFCHCAQ